MQVTETIYRFMNDGILSIQEYSVAGGDAHIIEELQSSQALDYVHTIDTRINVLRQRDNLWCALKVFLQKNNKVTNLLLNQSYMLPPYNMNDIIKILCEFKNITNLELILLDGEHRITEICALNKYFDVSTIKNLGLKSSYRVIRHVMESIASCKSIETVNLTITNVESEASASAPALVPIPMLHKIRKICFSNFYILIDHMEAYNTFLERFLALNPTIVELRLSSVPMSTDTVRIISDFIESHCDITTLSICSCNIDDESIDILVRALETSNVETLDINDNNVKYGGAVSIATMLKLNKSLKVINIGNNAITYEGVVEILEVLATNSTVSKFCCTGSIFVADGTPESVTQTFEKILSDNYTLIDFFVHFKYELPRRTSRVCIKLDNITRRNEQAFNELRFVKTKPVAVVHQL